MSIMHASIFDPLDDVVYSGYQDYQSRQSYSPIQTKRPSLVHSFSSNSIFPQERAITPPSKDLALDLLTRKIKEMEAKLNNQTAMMLQLRDENLFLKERVRKGSDTGSDEYIVYRETRTEPATPLDTAVKAALLVLGESERAWEPHPEVVARILSQSFSYSLVLPHDYRSLTWTLAHRVQRSAQEGHALKFAVNFLISKVHQLRGQPLETVVQDAILAELIGLAQTANGNYLVQQLLECGGTRARMDVYEGIREHLLQLANDKYGTHVVCKAAEFDDIRVLLIPDLIRIGVAESFQTGARRLWKSIFESSKKAGDLEVFDLVLRDMKGKWAECATSTENGTISVQQVFETWPSRRFMEPVLDEVLGHISRIANGGWGHFLISKLLGNGAFRLTILEALVTSTSPVAIGHHGVSFLRTALLELGRPGVERYVEALCSSDPGHAAPIVEIAGAVVGPAHVSYLWTLLTTVEKVKLKDACRASIVSIRGSQSGNDTLRMLGLMPTATASRLR